MPSKFYCDIVSSQPRLVHGTMKPLVKKAGVRRPLTDRATGAGVMGRCTEAQDNRKWLSMKRFSPALPAEEAWSNNQQDTARQAA